MNITNHYILQGRSFSLSREISSKEKILSEMLQENLVEVIEQDCDLENSKPYDALITHSVFST
jgi:hypothetical protein